MATAFSPQLQTGRADTHHVQKSTALFLSSPFPWHWLTSGASIHWRLPDVSLKYTNQKAQAQCSGNKQCKSMCHDLWQLGNLAQEDKQSDGTVEVQMQTVKPTMFIMYNSEVQALLSSERSVLLRQVQVLSGIRQYLSAYSPLLWCCKSKGCTLM